MYDPLKVQHNYTSNNSRGVPKKFSTKSVEQWTSMFFQCYVDTWKMNVPAVMKFTHTNMYMKNETEQFGDTLFLHGYFII